MSAAAQPFNPRLVVGLIIAGLIGFAALILLIAYGGGLNGSGDSARANALSRSAIGYQALYRLASDFRTTRLARDDSAFEAESLLVVTPGPQGDGDALARLIDERGGRPTLVILPKWMVLPDPGRRGWVRAIRPGMEPGALDRLGKALRIEVLKAARGRAHGRELLDGIEAPLPRSPQVVSGPDVEPLIVTEGGGALLARLRGRQVFVAADPDLFNNHGLRNPARARAALAILDGLNETGTDRIDFDLTLSGPDAAQRTSRPNMLRVALEPPFLAMTLALLAAALFAGLHGAFRFGPVRPPARALPFGKAALVENSAGLIRRAGREPRLGAAYAGVLRHAAARAARAPQWLGDDRLDAYLDRLTQPGSETFSTLAARLADARDRAGLVAAARALFQWKKEAIR